MRAALERSPALFERTQSMMPHENVLPMDTHRPVVRSDRTIGAILVEEGKLTPVIDRTYSLSEAADALRYVQAGYARGSTLSSKTPLHKGIFYSGREDMCRKRDSNSHGLAAGGF